MARRHPIAEGAQVSARTMNYIGTTLLLFAVQLIPGIPESFVRGAAYLSGLCMGAWIWKERP